MANIFCFIYIIIGLAFSGHVVEASECCTSYTDNYGDRHDQEWCANYCCYDNSFSLRGKHECCSSYSRRVPSYHRDETCSASFWWSTHVYVPVLIAIGSIATIVVCCVVCIKACTGSSRTVGVVHQPPQSQVAVVMAGHPGPSMYPPQGQGYPQGYPPQEAVYPPPYSSGPPPPPTKY